jgi:hypothetical protein
MGLRNTTLAFAIKTYFMLMAVISVIALSSVMQTLLVYFETLANPVTGIGLMLLSGTATLFFYHAYSALFLWSPRVISHLFTSWAILGCAGLSFCAVFVYVATGWGSAVLVGYMVGTAILFRVVHEVTAHLRRRFFSYSSW